MVEDAATFIVECFWPGVTQGDVEMLDARAVAAASALTQSGRPLRYLGSILMQDDEVVLCEFEGPEDTVRRAAESAEIPFARIVKTARSPRRA